MAVEQGKAELKERRTKMEFDKGRNNGLGRTKKTTLNAIKINRVNRSKYNDGKQRKPRC